MGIIYGLINMAVAYWFFNAAISVRKPAFKWAGIGAVIFLLCLFTGNIAVKQIQGSVQSSNIDQMIEKGYVPSSESKTNVRRQQKKVKGITFMAVVNDLFPLILAILVVAFVRAKVLLGVGFKESLQKNSGKEKLVDIGNKDQE